MDFKFDQYIQVKNFGKSMRGRIQGLPQLFGLLPIISGMGKATNFKFYGILIAAITRKAH